MKNSLDIIKGNYLDFATYTISHRTYPHVLDGLKEAQRRILYAAYNDAPKSSMIKLSTLLGLVMQYHPHAETTDTVVKLAGEHHSSFPLFDTQGNFGDLENPASAPRYIELKLKAIAKDMYFKLIDYTEFDNFEVKNEPLVLPTLFPVALMQGTFSIGQGTPNTLIPELDFNSLKQFIIDFIKTGNKTAKDVKFSDYEQMRDDKDKNKNMLKVLNEGKGTVVYSPTILQENNKITISNVYCLATFSKIVDYFKDDIKSDKINVLDNSDENGRVWIIEKVKNKTYDMNECIKKVTSILTYRESYAMYFHNDKGQVKLYSLGEIIELCYKNYSEKLELKLKKEIKDLEKDILILKCLAELSEDEDCINIITNNILNDNDKINKLYDLLEADNDTPFINYSKDIIKICVSKPINMLKNDVKAIKVLNDKKNKLSKERNNIDNTILLNLE